MNLLELLRAELELWLAIGIPVAVLAVTAMWAWSAVSRGRKAPKPKGPHIPLDAPCPACGNIGCMLNYDAAAKCVLRKCVHCGCVLKQQPVAPSLFSTDKK